MTPGQLAQARDGIRQAHARLIARIAGAEPPDLLVVMLETDGGLRELLDHPGTLGQLDDIIRFGRDENIVVQVTAGP